MASSIMRAFPATRRRADIKPFGLPARFAVALAAIALISLLYLSQTSAVATAGYNVKRLEEQKAQLELRNEQLRSRIAHLQALQRVESEAAQRLKMGPPTKSLFLPIERRIASSSTRDNAKANAVEARSLPQPVSTPVRSRIETQVEIDQAEQRSDAWWSIFKRALGL